MRDVHRKSFEQRSKSPTDYSKTEVAESPIPSHTDVVADYAQRTNYILFNVGIGTCLNVGGSSQLVRMRLRWRNFGSP